MPAMYSRVYLPIVTGDSREHPLFTILRAPTTESHRGQKGDALDGALAYSNLLRTRSSARRAAPSTMKQPEPKRRPPEARLLPASEFRRIDAGNALYIPASFAIAVWNSLEYNDS